MSLTPIVCIDIDGVIGNIEPPMVAGVEKHFNVKPQPGREGTFYLEDRYDVDSHEINNYIHEVLFRDPEFWFNCGTFEHNVDALKIWWDGLYVEQIFLVTGRNHDSRDATERWAKKYGVPYNLLFMDTLEEKYKIVKWAGADFLIEDRLTEAIICAKNQVKCYLIEYPHNVAQKDELISKGYGQYIKWVKDLHEIGKLEGWN